LRFADGAERNLLPLHDVRGYKRVFVAGKHERDRKEQQKMQKVMLIGNLGRDPDVKYSQQGTAIAQFSVATTERWKDKAGEPQEHTEWFTVKAFGRRAEIVGENLHKGSRVYLEGRKRTESWDDKQTGAKHYRDLVYVDRIEFLDSMARGNGHRDPVETTSGETTVTDEETPF
jgi:single-strand DNA-binding protein